MFTSVRKVLQGACHMVALQLAAEPLVRQAVRQVFQTRALLNVKPTKRGKKARPDVCVLWYNFNATCVYALCIVLFGRFYICVVVMHSNVHTYVPIYIHMYVCVQW